MKKKMSSNKRPAAGMRINLAYFREEDWELLRSISEDKHKMRQDWKDWLSDYEKARRKLVNVGFDVVDIIVDINELIQFCITNGIPNNSGARSRFAASKG